ncbi:Flavin reductase- FMN-binding protein [Rutstroemia sp. NJR-2017a WRK4]|nr:Flavin reductase- FMN-binding protein [Rutstroemia sp. NJR-2017a WRK4]
MIGRHSGVFVQAQQSIAVSNFHKVFWRWQALGKHCEKYHSRATQPIFNNALHNPSKLAASISFAHQSSRFYSSAATTSGANAPAETTKGGDGLDVSDSVKPVDTTIIWQSDNNPDLLLADDLAPEDDITKPEPPPEPLSSISSNLRDVMRRLVNSVVVMGVPNFHQSTIVGATLSSFTTVTLTPKPIVTFNIKRPSRTLTALKATLDASGTDHPNTFEIYILEARSSAVDIATAFSRDGRPTDISLLYDITTERARRILRNGVRRALVCKLLDGGKGLIEVGDHTLVLGEVVEIQQPEPVMKEVDPKKHPILRGLKRDERAEMMKTLPREIATEKNWTPLAYSKGRYISMENTPIKTKDKKKNSKK